MSRRKTHNDVTSHPTSSSLSDNSPDTPVQNQPEFEIPIDGIAPKFEGSEYEEDVHLTHRRGNEDALELGMIEKPHISDIDLPDTPDMMDPTGKASLSGSVLRQNEPLFNAPYSPDTMIATSTSPNAGVYLPPDPSTSTLEDPIEKYSLTPNKYNITEDESMYGKPEMTDVEGNTYRINELSIRDRALIVEEDVNFHNAVSADIDLLWANDTPLKDILLHLYNSENTKNKIFKLEASKYYFSILTSECSYTDIISDDMYTLDYFLSQPVSWFKCYMPKNLENGRNMREEYSDADASGIAVMRPDKMVISSSYNLLSKFQVHNNYSVPLDGLWLTFNDTLYSMGYFMERWYYEISVATNIKSDSTVYERIDEINNEFLSKASKYEISSLVSFFNNTSSTFIDTTPRSNLGRIYEAYEMLLLIPTFPMQVI